jgi:hypothetical protein
MTFDRHRLSRPTAGSKARRPGRPQRQSAETARKKARKKVEGHIGGLLRARRTS